MAHTTNNRVPVRQRLFPAAYPDDDLEGEDVVPGFRCRVDDLYSGLPPAAPQA